MPERIRCNLCGADDAEPLFRLRDYRLQVDEVEWTAVRCQRCGLGYLNPRPTREEVRRYYPARYFEHRPKAVDRYRRQAAYAPGRGRLLDIGTAGGEFLCVMRERGWDVAGIEPGAPRTNTLGLTIARVNFPDESGFEPESFDVITAWAVFEHLRVVRTTDLFGGSGRGVLRLLMLRALGEPISRYFDMNRTPIGERFRRAPLLAILWSAVDAVERVVLPDWLVRWARMSGQILVTFSKLAPEQQAGVHAGATA